MTTNDSSSEKRIGQTTLSEFGAIRTDGGQPDQFPVTEQAEATTAELHARHEIAHDLRVASEFVHDARAHADDDLPDCVGAALENIAQSIEQLETTLAIDWDELELKTKNAIILRRADALDQAGDA